MLGPAGVAEAAKKKGGGGATYPHPSTPDAALQTLMRGNARYRKGKLLLNDYSPVGENAANKQAPFAAIITCADSRITTTLMFDVHRGNLFVCRVAGNSIDQGTLGSTEFAVKVLGVKLVMVLGHTNCGAVNAAIGVANGTSGFPREQFGQIGAVVDEIVPVIKAIPPDQRNLPDCIRANAIGQAADIAATQPIIKPAVDAGTIKVVAAVYDIATGKVQLA